EVHAPNPPGRLVALLAVDRDGAGAAAVGFDEVGALDEQAAGTAGGVEHAALVGLEHLDQQLGDRGRRVELAAAVPLSLSEHLDEVLVGAPEVVARLLLVLTEPDLADLVDQLAERRRRDWGAAVDL